MYKPCRVAEMVTPAIHQKPTYSPVNGREVKTYTNAPRPNIRGKYKEIAKEVIENGVVVIHKKITYETWHKTDLKGGDRLIISGAPYELKGDPENVEGRGRYCVCNLETIKGGA